MTRLLIFTLAGLMSATVVSAPAIPRTVARGVAAAPDAVEPRIEVVGDLSTADRIAVIVPGVGVTAGNFDHGLGHVRRRSPVWQARRLHAAATRLHAAPAARHAGRARNPAPRQGGGRLVVVAWLGYRPPAGVGWDAVRSDAAVAGGAALRRFVSGLPRRARVTLIGHSYGSLVLAYAAPGLPPTVTDLVVLGSPGMDVRRAADLGTTARIWAGRADGDWIRWVPGVRIFGLGHGADPVAPEFGARHLDVTGAYGHDRYFRSGSLRSLAAIASGDTDRPGTGRPGIDRPGIDRSHTDRPDADRA